MVGGLRGRGSSWIVSMRTDGQRSDLTLRCSQEAHGKRATAAGGAAEEAEVNHGGGGFTSKEKNEDLSMRAP